MNTAERAEFQGLLRILRPARIPPATELRFVISEKTLIESGSSVCLITLIFRFILSTCAIIDAFAGRLRVTTSFPIPFDQLVFLHPPLVRASSSKGSATAMSMLSFGLHWLDLLVGRVSA
jgi:hypothetical protein